MHVIRFVVDSFAFIGVKLEFNFKEGNSPTEPPERILKVNMKIILSSHLTVEMNSLNGSEAI